MDSEKLRVLLEKAIKSKLTRPIPTPWVIGTSIEQELNRHVSAPADIKKEMIEFFESQSELGIFNNKLFNRGNSWTNVSYETLLQWMLYIATSSNIDVVVNNLKKYINLKSNPAIEILAISGIDVDTPIELSNNITLIPFSKIPECGEKDMLDPPLLRRENLEKLGMIDIANFGSIKTPPQAALIRPINITPQTVNSHEDIHNHILQSNLLYEACECFTLLKGCAPLPTAHWCRLEDWIPCSSFLGSGWSSAIHDVVNSTSFKIEGELIHELRLIQSSFLSLNQDIKDKLRIPIQRLNQARRRTNIADKAIDLGVAFESLYLGDRSHKEQISYTFRLRAAWYLGSDKNDREIKMDTFNKVYECRSKAVHTGKLDNQIKIRNRGKIQTIEFLNEADMLCVDSIKKVIQARAFPEWDKIILGE